MEWVYGISGIIVGGLIVWLIARFQMGKNNVSRAKYEELDGLYQQTRLQAATAEAKIAMLNQEKLELRQEINQLRQVHDEKLRELQEAKLEIAGFQSQLRYQQEQFEQQKASLEDMGDYLRKEFQLLANSILEEKTEKFTVQNAEKLKTILDPLNLQIREFRTKVEEAYDKESKERFSLGERIRELVELNQRISEEASNLARALKGDTKKQGDWGEMLLESVLENSGLVKGREYKVQEYITDESGVVLKNEAGQAMRPDVIVYYPDKRCLVIDAKVSLTAYDRFAAAEDRETQEKELNAHVASLRNHIDGLSARQYQNYVDSLDWVVLFVPIEPAYLVALRRDPKLWEYAYSKKIILVSPTNLMAVLKITSDLWTREKQRRNAEEIAERGGRLYDKFVTFVESVQDIGTNLERTRTAYEKAVRQLKEGNGNLIRQAEQMRELGIKSSKRLPGAFTADLIDDEPNI